MPFPIRAGAHRGKNVRRDVLRVLRSHPEQDDSMNGGGTPAKCQFAKVLVKGDENASFGLRPRENGIIAATRCFCANPNDIVAGLS